MHPRLARRLTVGLFACRLLLAQAPVVTDTHWVENWEEKGKGREQLRKINGRWWSEDNREVFPPAKDGFFWTLDSKPGTCRFFHHRPFQLSRAESIHLWMTPQEVEAALGQPNRTFGMDNHGFWYYYASNGTKLEVRFMGEGVVGEAKYIDIREKSSSVASIATELNGRDIYKLLAERATMRLRERPLDTAGSYPARGPHRRVQPSLVTVGSVPVDPAEPAPPKRIISAEAYRTVAIGATREDVVTLLGEPSSRYAMTGDDGTRESFTYDLDNGESVVIRLTGGKVTKVR